MSGVQGKDRLPANIEKVFGIKDPALAAKEVPMWEVADAWQTALTLARHYYDDKPGTPYVRKFKQHLRNEQRRLYRWIAHEILSLADELTSK